MECGGLTPLSCRRVSARRERGSRAPEVQGGSRASALQGPCENDARCRNAAGLESEPCATQAKSPRQKAAAVDACYGGRRTC
jgi:hypothetical protein